MKHLIVLHVGNDRATCQTWGGINGRGQVKVVKDGILLLFECFAFMLWTEA